jgi:hypothetical protein
LRFDKRERLFYFFTVHALVIIVQVTYADLFIGLTKNLQEKPDFHKCSIIYRSPALFICSRSSLVFSSASTAKFFAFSVVCFVCVSMTPLDLSTPIFFMTRMPWKTLTAGNQALGARHQAKKSSNPENKLAGKPNRSHRCY